MPFCRVCKETKPASEFYAMVKTQCKDCRRAKGRAQYRKDPASRKNYATEYYRTHLNQFHAGDRSPTVVQFVLTRLLNNAKKRHDAGDDTITAENFTIPLTCPFTNRPLVMTSPATGDTMTLWKRDADRPYTPDNTLVVSMAAYRLLNTGVSEAELAKIWTTTGDLCAVWCEQCMTIQPVDAFHPADIYQTTAKGKCRTCASQQVRISHDATREAFNDGKWTDAVLRTIRRQLWTRAKQRARAANILFDITPEDIVIPSHCPVLNIPLTIGKDRSASPSLDRIIPANGYTRGNIAVISMRANAIKNDATAEEIQAVASWVRAQQS